LKYKERIANAISHKSTKIPIDLGAFPTTGIHSSTLEKLREMYGLEKRMTKILEPYQMLGLVEDDLREAIGIATQPFWSKGTMFGFDNDGWKEWETPWGQTVLVSENFNTTDEGDKVHIYPCGDMNSPASGSMPKSSYFFDTIIRQKPIVEEKLDYRDNLQEFGDVSNEDLEYYKNLCKENEDSEYFLCGNFGGTAYGDIALIPGPGIKDPKGIRDVAEWYMSTAIRQDYIHKMFEAQTEIALRNLEKIYAVVGDSIGATYICGNDFGTQAAPFCSPDTFKSLYAPYYKIINDWIHKNTKWKTFKHSCGSIKPLIGGMVECGFDILNPIQWTANNMEAKELKAEFGKDIVFWGGGVDTQHTLPFGTPEEVRKEVLGICETFSDGGGFVFATIHNVQAMVPAENLFAMFNAIKEFNGEL